jgi:hypothetical protein
MPRKAKGKRPTFFNDPQIDTVMGIVMALAGEVSVLRERLDSVERLVAAKGLFTQHDLEAYRPDDAVLAERERWRAEYIERVLRVVHQELAETDKGETTETYQAAVRAVSS